MACSLHFKETGAPGLAGIVWFNIPVSSPSFHVCVSNTSSRVLKAQRAALDPQYPRKWLSMAVFVYNSSSGETEKSDPSKPLARITNQ